jgi:hypothetical protein
MRGVHPVRGPPGYCSGRRIARRFANSREQRAYSSPRHAGEAFVREFLELHFPASLAIGVGEIIKDNSSLFLGLRRNQQPDEISGDIPALPLGDARISQHAAANGAHAMSKLEGAP